MTFILAAGTEYNRTGENITELTNKMYGKHNGKGMENTTKKAVIIGSLDKGS
ncbi:hypothetical protein [Psychromonas ingrahamii]|uniref:hypothetical protein n=1 Tax=Psychromonas ingrahamii TaxID=357794 RepID=UPI000301110E|nr:hypothetical protein [Psychromonas ingrahamii]